MLFISISVFSQDIYSPILKEIENNSTTLRAYEEKMEAQKLENKTGLTPANPEVEFAYLWASPSSNGNRKDVSVSQSFDFPSVYARRNDLSDLRNNSSDLEFRAQRMQLLLSAKNLLIQLVYYNALASIYNQHLENCTKIADSYKRMLDLGQTTQIEFNKAILNLANINNEAQTINLQRNKILSDLSRLNGGQHVSFDATSYNSAPLPPDFESWYADAEAQNPALQYLKSEVEVSDKQVSLAKASNWPKFSVGYMGEFVKGNNFEGVTVGLSLPLWENRNKVKQAKASAQASSLIAEDAKLQYYCQLKDLYAQALALQANIQSFAQVFDQNNNADLLYKAFSKGEISLLTYVLEMEYFLSAYDNLLKAKRDYELALASLNAPML